MDKLSVIICTYNPNEFIFTGCLQALEKASALATLHEIIIVDNNSTPSLAGQSYVEGFLQDNPQARIVVETKQGLTPARLRGIKEATGDILVFIDDDNWVAPDFFSEGLVVAAANPHIGSWSGQVKLHFQNEPEPWTRRYWGLLVHREFNEDKWSNFPHLPETMPCGAGLFTRKPVAAYYEHLHNSGKRDIQLDRTGSSLFSGGDNDLAACACDIGLGVGLFHKIVLLHYIPTERMTKPYLLKLAEGISASSIVFRAFRNELPARRTLKNKIADSLRLLMKRKTDKEFYKAVLRGERKGNMLLRSSFPGNS